MKDILSTNNPFIKQLQKLKNKKNVISSQRYLVEGKHIIEEAIANNALETLLVSSEDQFPNFQNRILVTSDIISKLSSVVNDQGLIGVCIIEEMDFDISSFSKLIVLDSINNPSNLGSIIRSAKAFKFDAIILLNDSVFKYNTKTINSSQGAIFNYPILKLDGLGELLSFKPFYFVLDDDSKSISDIDIPNEKYAIVLGNEANGIDKAYFSNWSGKNVKIDIDSIESLSLPIAAGIAMYKFNGRH